jgi:sulfotransferase
MTEKNKIKGGFFSNPQQSAESKTFYFMAGLPRSGSSALSAILNQNPRFYSGPSSPVLSTMFAVENHLQNDELFFGYPKPAQADLIISSLIHQFYSDVDKPVVFDKNRAWTARVPYIEGYIRQQAKILVPVRSIDEILTSMIMMIRRNPYQEGMPRINFIDEQLVKQNIPINDTNRCEFIAGPQGILGQSLNAIMEAFKQEFQDRLYFIEYQDLVKKPEKTMKGIYEFLGEKYYEHDFNSLENQNRERDIITYGLSDMHEVRPELKSTAPDPKDILPEEIITKCEGTEFWRQTKSNINIIK